MDVTALLNGTGALIVLGGTFLATLLGSGRRELAAACHVVGQLFHERFDYEQARREIARDVETMRQDGILRSGPIHTHDSEIAMASLALIHDRSLNALIEAHERFKRQRTNRRKLALRPIRLAAEMAPVFGMAGTLFSLSQLDHDPAAGGLMLDSIGVAIATTLYGLLLAHLVLHPLASLIERRGQDEEDDRQRLIDWMAAQLAGAVPGKGPATGSARLGRVV
ncbi:MAG: MotA/TolQ/ExbB proton channel family protein [Alteraurantiacibacter sp.]|nr:MotA/TolQ/ExbB proton channel family protein [Alteraurantiacibacter sp.]